MLLTFPTVEQAENGVAFRTLTRPCFEYLDKKMRKLLKSKELPCLNRKEFCILLGTIGIGQKEDMTSTWNWIEANWTEIESVMSVED